MAWEAPHYHTSAITARTAPQLFTTTYQRVVYFTADKPNFYAATAKDFGVGQFYPYVISKDYYGQHVLPENLGNIEYDIRTIDPTSNYNYTADDLITQRQVREDGARRLRLVLLPSRSGSSRTSARPASRISRRPIEGITALGFTWVAPSTLR